MKAGLSYTPYQNNTLYDYYVNGDFYFYGSGGSSYLNNDKAAFLFGLPDEFLQFGQAPSNIRTHNIGFFAQDEWRELWRALRVQLAQVRHPGAVVLAQAWPGIHSVPERAFRVAFPR
jgi:hypothetical protein